MPALLWCSCDEQEAAVITLGGELDAEASTRDALNKSRLIILEASCSSAAAHFGVSVVEIEATMQRVFGSVDGTRTVEEIAARATAYLQSAHQALEALAEIGAVRAR